MLLEALPHAAVRHVLEILGRIVQSFHGQVEVLVQIALPEPVGPDESPRVLAPAIGPSITSALAADASLAAQSR